MNRVWWFASNLGLVASALWCLGLGGCAVQAGQVYVKDGQAYGVTASHIWRAR